MSSTKLYRFQRIGVRQIERFKGRVLLADEMGLGKSLQSLWYAKHYLDRGPIVVVCPGYLKWNWQREASKHIDSHVEICVSRKPPKHAGRFLSRNAIYVVNYEILKWWLPFIKKLRPRLVIGDEVQYISNPTAGRSKAFKALCKGVPHVIALSGTPFESRPVQFWFVLNILCPKVFPSFNKFAQRYCKPRLRPWGWEFKGATNTAELNRLLLKHCMIRRRKQDVLKDLPPKTRSIVPIHLEGTAKREYETAEKDFVTWLKKTHPNKANKARRAERLVKVGYLKRLIGRLKLPDIKRWTDTFLLETKEKLLTFGVHRDAVVLDLFSHYADRGAVVVHGKVKGSKRQAAFDQFNTDKRVRLMFGNVRAAGTGWNCTSASKVAFAEIGWTPGEHVQAEDRIYGMFRGVKGVAAMVYYFLGVGTIDETIFQLIWEKQKVSSAVLDGEDMDDQEAVLDQLEEILIKRKGKK